MYVVIETPCAFEVRIVGGERPVSIHITLADAELAARRCTGAAAYFAKAEAEAVFAADRAVARYRRAYPPIDCAAARGVAAHIARPGAGAIARTGPEAIAVRSWR